MDEDEDRRLGAVGAIDIQLSDLCRSVREALRRAD
jgi:hypothetical protein